MSDSDSDPEAGMTMAEPYCPQVLLDPGAPAWNKPADLSPEQKASIQVLLQMVKRKILPTGESVTDAELTTFLKLIFDEWKVGDLVFQPSDSGTMSGKHDCQFTFGILAESAMASAQESGKKKSRARANGGIHRRTGKKTKKRHRREGQPVALSVDFREQTGFMFHLRDRKGGLIAGDNPVRYTKVANKVEAYLAVMCRHDEFYIKRVHTYNIEVATYLARNRITFWANGANVDDPLQGESVSEALLEVRLIRRVESLSTAPTEALVLLKQKREPTLF